MTGITDIAVMIHDEIIPWHEVQTGDLVLFQGTMRSLEAMWPAANALHQAVVGVRLRYAGEDHDFYVDSNGLTAVRRYLTEEH